MHSFFKHKKNPENSVFFERKRMLKKEAAGWEGSAAETISLQELYINRYFCGAMCTIINNE